MAKARQSDDFNNFALLKKNGQSTIQLAKRASTDLGHYSSQNLSVLQGLKNIKSRAPELKHPQQTHELIDVESNYF